MELLQSLNEYMLSNLGLKNDSKSKWIVEQKEDSCTSYSTYFCTYRLIRASFFNESMLSTLYMFFSKSTRASQSGSQESL